MNLLANFAFVPKNLKPEKVIDAWTKLSNKYEPIGSKNGMVRRNMLEVLKGDAMYDRGNVKLLTKNTVMPNGVPGTVYTGVAHMPVNNIARRVSVHTLAGNPLSVKNDMYKGAINSLGDVLENYDDNFRVKIHTTKYTNPLYRRQLGYIDSPTGDRVGNIRQYRSYLRKNM